MLAGSQAQHCCCVNTNSCCCNCPHFQRNMWLNNTGCKSRVCARITTHSIFPLVPACPHPPLASSTSSAAGWRRPRWPAGRSPRSTPGPAPPGAWAGAAQRATRGGGTACHCLGSEVWVGGWVGGGGVDGPRRMCVGTGWWLKHMLRATAKCAPFIRCTVKDSSMQGILGAGAMAGGPAVAINTPVLSLITCWHPFLPTRSSGPCTYSTTTTSITTSCRCCPHTHPPSAPLPFPLSPGTRAASHQGSACPTPPAHPLLYPAPAGLHWDRQPWQ
jgi:hypothetical protein